MIEFLADQVKVAGPKVDGSYSITFSVGEYEHKKVAELLSLPQDTVKKVSVEVHG